MLEKAYELFYSTLSNKNRLKILGILRRSPKTVSQLCAACRMNQTTASHNLLRLLECGFVFVERRGRERVYSINKQTILPLFELMDYHVNNFCEKRCE